MGDSTKPGPLGEGENVIQLASRQKPPVSGKHQVALKNGAEAALENTAEISATGIAPAVANVRGETAENVQDNIADVLKLNFSNARKNGLRGSHQNGKGLKTSATRPGVKKTKHRAKSSGPNHPKVDGLIQRYPHQKLPGIVNGKRTEVDHTVVKGLTDIVQESNKVRISQIFIRIEQDLNAMEKGISIDEAVKLLFEASREDFGDQKREEDMPFFNAVGEILLKIWPSKQYLSRLDDARVYSMLRMLQGGPMPARLKAVLETWQKIPVGNTKKGTRL